MAELIISLRDDGGVLELSRMILSDAGARAARERAIFRVLVDGELEQIARGIELNKSWLGENAPPPRKDEANGTGR